MTLPNFLIIGAAKAGTTALYHSLRNHPEIFMSAVKEPAYFAVDDQNLNVCGPQGNKLFPTLPSYEALFEASGDAKAIGEASTVYLYSSSAPKKIYSHIPNVKLIVILRNPVDRAFAHFVHACREGFENTTDFNIALQHEQDRIIQRWRPIFHYRQMGFYYTQLQKYRKYFKPEQMKIYIYESEYLANPAQITSEIFEFIGVDPTYQPSNTGQYNKSGIPKNRLIHQAYQTLSKHKNLKELLSPVAPLLRHIKNKNLAKPVLSDEMRRKLLGSYYSEIQQLQGLINKDLSIWLDY